MLGCENPCGNSVTFKGFVGVFLRHIFNGIAVNSVLAEASSLRENCRKSSVPILVIYVHAKDDFCNYEFINKFLLLLLSGGKGEGGSGRVQLLPWEFLHFSVSCCAQPYTGALLPLT